jgi:tetratricopeptide (TPR) repeat protein
VINAYAIAALWYGEAGAAQEAWGRSLEQNGEHFITQYNLRGQLEPVERRVAPVLAGASRWLPISRSDGRPLSDGCSYSTPYRRVVLKFASPELRDLMLEQLFAAAPTELAAKAVLVEAVGWRVGPDSARLALLGRLVEQGLIDRRAILQVTLFGATHEVQLLLPESLRNATLWDSADAQASNCAAAVLLLQSKQFEAARAMLRRCLEDSPQHVVLSCLLAEALCQGPAPDYETANRLLDEILLARPDYLRARALRASVFLGRHELIAARDELESCAAIDASNSLDLTLLHRVWFDYSVAAADAAGKHRSACHVYLIEALAAKLNPAA